MCLLRINLPNLCPNMNHFDAVDFSECHSEEVSFDAQCMSMYHFLRIPSSTQLCTTVKNTFSLAEKAMVKTGIQSIHLLVCNFVQYVFLGVPNCSLLLCISWTTPCLNYIQSTLPKSNSHKSNNCLSRRSMQVLFSLYSIVFNPS